MLYPFFIGKYIAAVASCMICFFQEEDGLKPSKTMKNTPNTKKLTRERPTTIAIVQELKSARVSFYF